MDCHYINLDQALDRRQSIEESFAAHKTTGWNITRFPAVNVSYIQRHRVDGALRDSEKACFMSHRRLLGDQIGSEEPVLILEDDTRFGSGTFAHLDHFVSTMADTLEWDILFTDVAIVDPKTMVELAMLRRELSTSGATRLLDLTTMPFAGATAYLVNPHSVEKIYGHLQTATPLDIPYDLFLRHLIWKGLLRGHVMFPFVTTISNWAESSQIQTHDTAYTDLTWNTFRKLVWLDRDLEQVRMAVSTIDREVCDEESRLLGTLVAACTSSRLVPK